MKINKYQRWVCIIAALLIGGVSFFGINGSRIGILMITALLFIAVKD